jgi:shikimate kinase
MGTGKTTVARRLASATGRDFVDTDEEIVLDHGPIPAIFERDGEEHFRELERIVVARLAPRRNLVISTGGGTMLDSENVLSFVGAEIYTLTAEPEEILTRLTEEGLGTRPLIDQAADPEQAIRSLLAERHDAYARFTSLDTTGKSIEEVIDALRDSGASIATKEEQTNAETASRSSSDVAITVAIALAVAFLIVLIVLVITF